MKENEAKRKADDLKVLQKFSELYEPSYKLKVAVANEEGDIDLLRKIFFIDKSLDILAVTKYEKWNYLHLANLLNPSPVEVIQFYIDNHVSVNAQDIYKMTPLHYAMQQKNAEASILLLNAGADPNASNEKGLIPLNYINGQPEQLDLLKLMLDKGANPNHVHSRIQITILESIKKYRSKEPQFLPVIEMMEKYIK